MKLDNDNPIEPDGSASSQVSAQSSNVGNGHADAVPKNGSVSDHPISSGNTIQTGGAYTAGSITNQGGVNQSGGTMRDVTYYDHHGDINLFSSTDLAKIIALKQIIPAEQANAVERLANALYQVGIHQKQISELKFFHNTLHDLEAGLAPIVNSIRNATRQREPLRLYDIEDNWKIAVLPLMQAMRVFASEEMRFLGEPRFEITAEGISGPQWVKTWSLFR